MSLFEMLDVVFKQNFNSFIYQSVCHDLNRPIVYYSPIIIKNLLTHTKSKFLGI